MPEAGLPHRAKPALLHEICRYIRENGRTARSEIYDSIGDNQKTLRRTLDYGVHLGFLEQDGNEFKLTGRGSGLAYSPRFEDEESVHGIFREAIEGYRPYREALAGAYATDKIDVVKEAAAILKENFKEELQKSVGREVQDREVNVLIKTAVAAGLGEYKVGRRKYQTRLVLNDDFETYASELIEKFSLPTDEDKEGTERSEDTEEEKKDTGEPDDKLQNEARDKLVQQSLTTGEGVKVADSDSRTITHVHIHVWAENKDEVDSLLKQAGGDVE